MLSLWGFIQLTYLPKVSLSAVTQALTRRLKLPALLLMSTLALAACKTPEERAQEYFESAMSLLAEGDEDRALIELRNVFQNDGFHLEARRTYADILRERGEQQEAYGQYLRLVEQYPDLQDVRLILAETAFNSGNWDEVERHGRVALNLDPSVPRAQAIGYALDYRDAVIARDETRRAEIAQTITGALEAQPDNLVLRQILIDYLVAGTDPLQAMPHVRAVLAQQPDNLRFNTLFLRLLVEQEDSAAVGQQLRDMVALFPDNVEVKQSLIQWYLSEQDLDGAEAFLRAEAGALTGETGPHVDVMRFITEVRSREEGSAYLQELVAANEGTANADLYGALLAVRQFEDGDTAGAVTRLEDILAAAEPSDQTRNIKAMQARFQENLGDLAGAKATIDEILAEDPTNVDALKMRAGWLIEDDQPGDAILALRTASSQAPRDVEIMTLLAAAFERDGSTDLAGEQLAQAVEASGSGVAESLRYATFLRGQGRLGVAETVLSEARRASGDNIQVLAALAEVLLQREDWGQLREITALLETSEDPRNLELAQRLQAAALLGQNRVEEGLGILQEQAANSEGDLRATIAVIMTQVRTGQTDQARAFLDSELAKDPENSALRLMSANLNTLQGNTDAAEAELRSLRADEPGAEMPVRMLFALLNEAGRTQEARDILSESVDQVANPMPLLFIQAGILEAEESWEDAIAVYERLYELNSSNVVVANNLASMLSTYRDDMDSLDRAHNIARRLRSMDVPAFKDTYGWIEYRRGNLEEAVGFLEDGAAGLPEDPLAQFHLGMVYADLGRVPQAIAQLEAMLVLAEGRNLPQIPVARARLEDLRAAATE